MDQITASQADRAAVAEVLRSLGPVAVVRMVPVTTATADQTRRRTHVLMYDATGADLTDQLDAEGAEIARDTVRSAFPGRVWTAGAYDYHAFSGRLLPVVDVRVAPGVPVLPLADAHGAAEDEPDDGEMTTTDDLYTGDELAEMQRDGGYRMDAADEAYRDGGAL